MSYHGTGGRYGHEAGVAGLLLAAAFASQVVFIVAAIVGVIVFVVAAVLFVLYWTIVIVGALRLVWIHRHEPGGIFWKGDGHA